MPPPLSDLTVLDLSRVMAGPWATQLLADLGARVIKVEQPGKGDETRGWGPPYLERPDGAPSAESAYYLSANRGKKSVTINLKSEAGRDLVRKLAAQSDVFIENFRAGTMARYGLAYADLAPIRPELVYCSITGFGQDGPRRDQPGFDYVIQGLGGLMSLTGEAGGAPMRVGVPIADLMTGMYAAVAILGALHARERTGRGQYIDLALLDVQAAMLSNQAMNALLSGTAPGRIGNTHPNIVPYQVFATRDGHLIVAAGNDRQFAAFCKAVGRAAWAADPRFATNADRVRHREDLVGLIEPVLKEQESAAWFKLLGEAGVPCGPIHNVLEALADPQLQHRGMTVPLTHPHGQTATYVRSPIRYGGAPPAGEVPAPELGQHTEEVLKSMLGLDEAAIRELRERQAI